MANKLLLKKSSVAAKVPLTTDLDYGELALNYADGKLYFKNSSNVIQNFSIGSGSVTSVSGTGTVSGLSLSGTVTTTGNLTLSGTLAVTASNFASQTSNTFLAAPNGTAGVPTFRTLVAADVPTLNQNTTGTSANVTGTVAVANGGTGLTSYTANGVLYASGTGTLANGTGLIFDGTNLGVGVTPTYKLHVNGSFAATTKSFVIDHPTKPGKQLRHGSLEGPENGVYVRGRLKGNKIDLPEYWTKLVDPDSITVNLTAIGKHQKLFVDRIVDNTVYVGGTNVDCFYTVFGERIDVDKLQVEIG